MGRVVTVASQKGGVGKTTTVVNLGAGLAAAGKRVLLVDFDPQANASSGVGFTREILAEGGGNSSGRGLLSVATEGKSVSCLVRETRVSNLSLIPSSGELSELELVRRAQRSGAKEFRAALRAVAGEYDLTIVDCPPSLGGLPLIALGASDLVVVPVQCEYYAMEGLSQIIPIVKKLQSGNNADLRIGGLLMTMYCDELELSREVEAEVRRYFGELVMATVIPRDVVVAEAASHGVPVLEYAPFSRGAWSYLELAKEVMRNGWT